jgi:type II secretory pathway component PulM
LACDLDAISASDRPRYNDLRKMLAASAAGKRELPDGIAVQIATERMPLAQLAEWISFERKCCPFLEFRIDVAPASGSVWVSMTGRTGVKEFLSQAFAR